MPKFEDKFVYFRWANELEGKKVLYAHHIDKLEKLVVNGCLSEFGVVQKSVDTGFPFEVDFTSWQFCYYDPYYELKWAHEQGKKIECKRKGDAWEDWDYTPSPEWLDDHEYRIMPEEQKPVTNRELAKWLAQGKGEYRCYEQGDVSPHAQVTFYYLDEDGSLPVKGIALVRKWEDSEWHEPTRAYLGLED